MHVVQHSGHLPGSFGTATSCRQEYNRSIGQLSRPTVVTSERNINADPFGGKLQRRDEAEASAERNLAAPEVNEGSEQPLKQLVQEEERGGKDGANGGIRPVALSENEPKMEFVWPNIIAFVILHASLPLALYLIYTQRPWKTLAFSMVSMYVSILGVTCGAHRLWSHRSYKAKWPVQVLLVMVQTLAGQNSCFTWARDHRLHHKYCETDADPHNVKRGLFFAHMGWLCCKKHPEVREKGRGLDMSDLKANPYVMFQHRHFWWMALIFTVLVPTMIPVICWNERFSTSFVLSFMFRYIVSLHFTWLVNSLAHYHGPRPYDTSTQARESLLLLVSGLGEHAHNYHHAFPHDYTTPEFGRRFNITRDIIDLWARMGLVHGRRRVSAETIRRRRERTGDLANGH